MDRSTGPPHHDAVPRFEIDASRSQFWVTAQSSLHPINATTTAVCGWIEAEVEDGRVDAGSPARARLEVDVDPLATGNPLYDRELHKRAEADRYPTIVGDLTTLSALGDDGQYRVQGDLTFHGVTRSAVDDMEVRMVDDHTVALAGSSEFDIRDFGLAPPRVLGLRVHPEVTVRVRLVAVSGG